MQASEIKNILEQALTLDEIYIEGEAGHFTVTVVSSMFEGMSRVKQQQAIYAPLMEHIRSNAIHALTIKALTPMEWERDKKLTRL